MWEKLCSCSSCCTRGWWKLNDYVGAIGGGDGFDVVYHHSDNNAQGNRFVDLFTGRYHAHKKPFFNYSGSVYLSFLAKQNSGSSQSNLPSGSAFTFNNINAAHNVSEDGSLTFYNGLGHPLPKDAFSGKRTHNPIRNQITGSIYQRFIFEASQSYWIPNTDNNDIQEIDTWSDNSSQVTVLGNNFIDKTGSSQIKDSTGEYPVTVVTQSGVPFFGSCMPAGEFFRIYRANTLSSSIDGYWRFDEGSGTTAFDGSGNGNHGTIKISGATNNNANGLGYTSSAVYGMGRSAGKFGLALDGGGDHVLLDQNASW